mmetsp:Transcript_4847/g.17060  ORF Transcript_4847/g.17060 Transcript_4847/m.17060 type:complete len:204 (-) Transcript_4847:190-801(-)
MDRRHAIRPQGRSARRARKRQRRSRGRGRRQGRGRRGEGRKGSRRPKVLPTAQERAWQSRGAAGCIAAFRRGAGYPRCFGDCDGSARIRARRGNGGPARGGDARQATAEGSEVALRRVRRRFAAPVASRRRGRAGVRRLWSEARGGGGRGRAMRFPAASLRRPRRTPRELRARKAPRGAGVRLGVLRSDDKGRRRSSKSHRRL